MTDHIARIIGEPEGDEETGVGPTIQEGMFVPEADLMNRSCLVWKGGYAEGICLDCGRVDIDLSNSVCECGMVPLVHCNDTEAGRRRVRERIEQLRLDPAARQAEKERLGMTRPQPWRDRPGAPVPEPNSPELRSLANTCRAWRGGWLQHLSVSAADHVGRLRRTGDARTATAGDVSRPV